MITLSDLVELLLEFKWLRRGLLLAIVGSLALFYAQTNMFIAIVAALIISAGLFHEFVEYRRPAEPQPEGGIQ